MKDKPKYIIYLRVSKEEQDARTQEEHCLRHLRSIDKSDFTYAIYTDSLTSKKLLSKRPGGAQALEALTRGSTLVAIRLDRLERNHLELAKLVDVLEKKNVEIILVTQPGIKNKILLGLYSGMAEEEVKLLRKRVREKMDAKRSRSERISGVIPYGYTMHPTQLVETRQGPQGERAYKLGALVPESSEQLVVARMLELSREGKSFRKIAMALTDQGYMNRLGKPFCHKTVWRILGRIERTMSQDQPPMVTVELQSLAV